METSTILIPGDSIGKTTAFKHGEGAYAQKGEVRASLTGKLITESIGQNSASVCGVVTSKNPAKNYAIVVGDIILGRVMRITNNQAFVEIVAVGDGIPCPFLPKAVIRKEEVRDTEIDKVVIGQFFRPGDVVRAKVVSLGDNKYYFLSTIGDGFGVVLPRNQSFESSL
jgi:exosome complex component CSL4